MDDIVIDYQLRTRVPTATEADRHPLAAASQGYCAVFELDGRWTAYRATSGGWMEATQSTRELAAQLLMDDVSKAREVWDGWVEDGERDVNGNQVIRYGHVLYTVQPTPTRDYPRGWKGFGGRHWKFRLLSSGQIVDTENLWFHGVIPTDYRDRLVDNAEQLPVVERWQEQRAGSSQS
jgi:hypothetical protein